MMHTGMTYAERTAELAVHLGRLCTALAIPQSANKLARIAGQLMRLERSAQRNAEQLCNVADYQPDFDRNRALHKKRISKILTDLGVQMTVELHGDPRGSCLVLFHPKLPGTPGEGYRVG